MPPEEVSVVDDTTVALAPQPYPFWNWIDLLLFVGLFSGCLVCLVLLMTLASFLWPSVKTNPIPLFLPLQIALYVAIYVPLRVVFKFRYDKGVFSSLGWKQVVTNQNLALFGVGGALLSPAIALIALALHTPEVVMDEIALLRGHWIILTLLGIIAVTIGPLFEELLFRGFLQPLFCKSFGVVGGIVLTAVLFGLPHSVQYKFVWQYVAAVSVVGAALGVVRYRTGSIIPSTVMHCCFNLVSSIGIFFPHK